MSAPVASTASRAQSTLGPTPSAGTYLALGDSLAVGVGATRPAELGYVARIGASIAPASTVNVAISGETPAPRSSPAASSRSHSTASRGRSRP